MWCRMYCKCYAKIERKEKQQLFGVLNTIFLEQLMLILLNNEQQEVVAALHVSCNQGCSFWTKEKWTLRESQEFWFNKNNLSFPNIIPNPIKKNIQAQIPTPRF